MRSVLMVLTYFSTLAMIITATACPESATHVGSCVQDTDCALGHLCQSGLCVAGTPCSTDGDCGSGSCINAVCHDVVRDAGLVSFDAAPHDAMQPDTTSGTDAYVPTCGLQITPDPVEFGAVRVGVEIVRELEIRNDNETDMQVLGVSIQNNSALNEFRIDSENSFMSGALPAGQSQIVRVIYSALDALPDNAQLQVLATGCEQTNYTADLTAEFKQSPSVFISDVPGDQGRELSSLDFGDVRVGQIAQAQIFIKNTHAESGLMIDAVQLQPASDGTFVVAQNFMLPSTLSQWVSSCSDDNGCQQAAGEHCSAGACMDSQGQYVDMLVVTLQFAPSAEQGYNSQLRILSTDAEHSPSVITLLGTGLPEHVCSLHDNASAAWSDEVNNGQGGCVWACSEGWFDLNGDLQLNIGSDGCEYECTVQDGVYDEPEMAFVDANCDGLDGVVEDGWFVSASAGSCTGQACGSKLHPFNNIEAAITAANNDATRKNIYVSDETYDLNQTLEIPPGLRIYGGYRVLGMDASLQWRDRLGVTHINGVSPALHISDAVSATAGHTLLQNLSVRSAAGTAQQANSIVAVVEDSPSLVFEAMSINAAAGLDGIDAVTVSAGVDGEAAAAGFDGCDIDSGSASCYYGGRGGSSSACAGSAGGRGGNGGTGAAGPDYYLYSTDANDDAIDSNKYGAATFAQESTKFTVSSGPFRSEHVGQFIAFSTDYCDSPSVRCRRITRFVSATEVELGLEAEQASLSLSNWSMQYNTGAESGEGVGGAVYGGAGGTAQNSCAGNVNSDPPTSKSCCGHDGADGVDGQNGLPGVAGLANFGFWDGEKWLAGDGGDGAPGALATGGEGGGGGGGGDCSIGFGSYSCLDLNNLCSSDRGGGGGGGGSAGCPGSGGLAGTGGGASIGILAIHSPFSIIGGQITCADGGQGGHASAGGAGGAGGAGAAGGNFVERSGSGGAGGAGGRGGYGGGGAGGSGGDVFGIAYLGEIPLQSGGVAFTLGQPGAAGLGGDGAPAGFCNGGDCGDGPDGHSGRAANSFALQ